MAHTHLLSLETRTLHPWLHKVHVLRIHGYMKYMYFVPTVTWSTSTLYPWLHEVHVPWTNDMTCTLHYTHMYVCMYVCMYHTISAHISISITSIRHNQWYTHTHTHKHTDGCTYIHMCTRVNKHAYTSHTDTLDWKCTVCIGRLTVHFGSWSRVLCGMGHH